MPGDAGAPSELLSSSKTLCPPPTVGSGRVCKQLSIGVSGLADYIIGIWQSIAMKWTVSASAL